MCQRVRHQLRPPNLIKLSPEKQIGKGGGNAERTVKQSPSLMAGRVEKKKRTTHKKTEVLPRASPLAIPVSRLSASDPPIHSRKGRTLCAGRNSPPQCAATKEGDALRIRQRGGGRKGKDKKSGRAKLQRERETKRRERMKKDAS